jgi:hypothetical protein
MKSYFHSQISFLPLFCSCQFRIFSSIQFLCSQAHILAGWHLKTRLTLLYNILHVPRRKHSLSSDCKACLQHRCIAKEVTIVLLATSSLPLEFFFTESLPKKERLFWLRYSGFRASCHNIYFNLMFTCPQVYVLVQFARGYFIRLYIQFKNFL